MICAAEPDISCTAVDNSSAADASHRGQRLRGGLAFLERRALLLHAAESFRRSGCLLLGRGRNDFGALLRLPRCGFRFQRRHRNRLATLGQESHFLAKLAQRQDDGLALLRLRGSAVGCRFDHRGDGGHLFLDPARQILCLTGTFLRRLGQCAHLVGNDRETAAVVAGARRLDGGIESEQIRLVRDVSDGFRHISDACRLLAQLFDDGDRTRLALAVMFDVARPRPDLVRRLHKLALQDLGPPPRRVGPITGLGQRRSRRAGDREGLL